ncbi:MAG: TatD family hydrolase [Spirochaetes bacterium]|nr:TatD family hydrolase [Spirochaetota bacterium]
MQLVDVHCHLESELYDGKLDEIIRDAQKAGIIKLVTSSVIPEEWEKSRCIADSYDAVEYAIGIHPWYVHEKHIAKIDDLVAHTSRGAIAIGEIGLDKKILTPPIDIQLRLFIHQLIVAKELNLPIIMHCRGAFNELFACIKQVGVPAAGGIVHSFSGNLEIAAELIKHGLSFSMGGVLTYRNSKKRHEVLRFIYPDHFMLETDSPDIPPVEAKNKLHTPANILYNLRAAAEILGVPEEKIAEATTNNAINLFKFNSLRDSANCTVNT